MLKSEEEKPKEEAEVDYVSVVPTEPIESAEPTVKIKATPVPVPSVNSQVQPKILSAQGISRVTQDTKFTYYGFLGTDEDGVPFVIGFACPTYRSEGFEKHLRHLQNVSAPKEEKENTDGTK